MIIFSPRFESYQFSQLRYIFFYTRHHFIRILYFFFLCLLLLFLFFLFFYPIFLLHGVFMGKNKKIIISNHACTRLSSNEFTSAINFSNFAVSDSTTFLSSACRRDSNFFNLISSCIRIRSISRLTRPSENLRHSIHSLAFWIRLFESSLCLQCKFFTSLSWFLSLFIGPVD